MQNSSANASEIIFKQNHQISNHDFDLLYVMDGKMSMGQLAAMIDRIPEMVVFKLKRVEDDIIASLLGRAGSNAQAATKKDRGTRSTRLG
jgi:hypothetical protein